MAPFSSSSSPSPAPAPALAPASSSSTASTPRAPRQQLPRGASSASSSSSPVYLNVYDVTPANGYARWLGLGVYHSGVQGMYALLSSPSILYAYGAHDGAGSGIFEVAPRRCPGYAFREAILVGTTELTRAEVRAVMADLAADFPGDAYNLVSRNCNHFCDAACRRLVRARIPRWVNRLAKIGVVFTCVIPGNGAAVRRKGDPPATATAPGGKASIRSRSARQGADAAAPPRPKTFFRSLSVGGGGGGGKNVTPRPLSTSPSPTPPAPPAFTTAT
uniref:PPPDE domain-containing protein n=1 Tax=Oryza glumipatula TaxID=40148 RepID=A0A0E0A5W4_9ORYZ